MDERIKAAIDADFFRKITDYEHGNALFLRVIDALKIQPVMHEFVAENELRGNQYLQELIDANKITIIRHIDYIQEEEKEAYEFYFKEAFERINKFDFPEGTDIYTYAEKQESLGEIRSFYMVKKLGYTYFMSGDADARTLVRYFSSSRHMIVVQTLYDVLAACRRQGTGFVWKDINVTATNAMRKRQDKLNELKEIYGESSGQNGNDVG